MDLLGSAGSSGYGRRLCVSRSFLTRILPSRHRLEVKKPQSPAVIGRESASSD